MLYAFYKEMFQPIRSQGTVEAVELSTFVSIFLDVDHILISHNINASMFYKGVCLLIAHEMKMSTRQ